jgi:hypothetical protein
LCQANQQWLGIHLNYTLSHAIDVESGAKRVLRQWRSDSKLIQSQRSGIVGFRHP